LSAPSLAREALVHVWQDNETDQDLLGFRVHADLIRRVITNDATLPITVGLFGDWGGGKSSVMKMLEKDLSDDSVYPNVVCLYFNGWTFEGYEDAKSALLNSILIQLGEHKRFGPKVKDAVVKQLKRVKLMELGKAAFKHVVVPVAGAALSGRATAVVGAVGGVIDGIHGAIAGAKEGSNSDSGDGTDWSKLIAESPDKPDLMGLRNFRDDFEKMLKTTDISSLIVLIDDLDRCLPERLIETLEAIKLFVAVPRTAFVIGADPRIVRHAIATRYAQKHLQHWTDARAVQAREEEENLIQDYLEKLIQIPYHLPRLSPSEIETYLNLLACVKCLNSQELELVMAEWKAGRAQDVYASFNASDVTKALSGYEISTALQEQLTWSTAVASVITEGLKGNPRQVKRMLNAMSLRMQLASVAGITIKEEVLAKLMVLEYSNRPRFQELNQWQAAEKGRPSKLKELEQIAQGQDGEESEVPTSAGQEEWQRPALQSWLRMRPALAEEDLRNYFWLARDSTRSTLAGVQMIAPPVQAVLQQLLSDNQGENALGVKAVPELLEQYRVQVIDLLRQDGEIHPDRRACFAALHSLSVRKVPGAAQALIASARAIGSVRLLATVPQNLAEIAATEPVLKNDIIGVLEELAKDTKSKAGKAAKIALEGLKKKV
jgi:predicted KAP-like P-loop ATPase